MFTEAEKVAIRRHAGYPAYGNSASGFHSHRFYQSYGVLEYRMSNLGTEEEAVVRTAYLAKLDTLEIDILKAGENLDTEAAAVWTRNSREHSDREGLYRSWRIKLCQFFGVPLGPALAGSNSVEIVV